MKHTILFVDDEENILMALKRIFRAADFELLTATSGKDGIAILKEKNVSVIVSDMKMPEMDGVEFLRNAMAIRPDSIRMVLSGYADTKSIMSAINEGAIWHFISKPTNNDELRMTLKNAMKLYEQGIEKQELINSLHKKTKELDAINHQLEKKVEQRTWLLHERSELLTMLVEDKGIELTLWRVCSSISQYLNGKPVFIAPFFLEHSFAINNGEAVSGELPPAIAALCKTVIDSEETAYENNNLGVLLKNSDEHLGVLLIGEVKEADSKKIERAIVSFMSFLDIALHQYKLSSSTPELLKNIDKLMGYM